MKLGQWIISCKTDKIGIPNSLRVWVWPVMKDEYKSRYQTLGLNVAYFRKKRGLTQEQLAEKAGVERSRISKTEIAWTGTSLDTVYRIADALEIEPYKLLMERE